MKDRREAILAELADLSLTLARDLHARALAASDEATACDLGLAFHRISRSLRQTLALEARLEREARAAEREDRHHQAQETLKRVQAKRREVRNAVSCLIWTEHEPDEAEQLFETLEALISDDSEDQQAFLETPLETCIARIREALGLPANDAEAEGEAPDDLRRSSG